MQKSKIIYSSFIISSLILIISCSNQKDQLPSSTGKTSEIMLVKENIQTNSKSIEIVKKYFSNEQFGLNQPEPITNIIEIYKSAFGDLFSKHRNILMLHISPKYKSEFITRSDVWASPQIAISLKASSDTALEKLFLKNADKIYMYFHQNDIKRVINAFERDKNAVIVDTIKKVFGVDIVIPSNYYIAKKTKNFIWLRKEMPKYSQALIIYSFPYNDTLQLNFKSIYNKRDAISKKFIQGDIDNSYMAIENKYIKPMSVNLLFKSHYAIETRGLWMVVNDFMGGPFINYTILDEKNNRIIVADGYVYAPNQEKRDLLIQLESIIHSIKF